MSLLACLALGACSSGSGAAGSTTSSLPATSAAPDAGSSAGSAATTSGIIVAGAYGTTPTVTIPATAAPTQLTQQTLVEGTGATIAAGDTLVANYVGETWAAKPNVFDSSFSRGAPAGFVIGTGQVIPGWDKTLVGKKVGSRVVLTIPPADGYGTSGNSQAGISSTDTLVFVVDLVATYKPDASAPGTIDSAMPSAGWPKITNTPATPPTITSVAGVTAPEAPTSKLLVKGGGAELDTSKTLVLQVVQTDLATGKNTESTWGQAPQLVAAANVVQVIDALSGQSVGARAIALLPATAAVPATSTSAAEPAAAAEIMIVDVVGQF